MRIENHMNFWKLCKEVAGVSGSRLLVTQACLRSVSGQLEGYVIVLDVCEHMFVHPLNWCLGLAASANLKKM